MQALATRYVVLVSCMSFTALATAGCDGEPKSGGSTLKVANGVELNEADWPATAKLGVLGTGLCTGTFLNDNTVLTARHCVDAADATGNVKVESGGATVGSLRAFVADGYDPSLPAVLNYETDLAVVVFPRGTGTGRGLAAGAYPRLSASNPGVGDWLEMRGFGGTDMSGANAGVLRAGGHHIMFVDDGGFSWVASPGEQNVAPGDSGSAGYVGGEIAGVATLAGDVLGIIRVAGFRGVNDGVASTLFDRAVNCDDAATCALEFRR